MNLLILKYLECNQKENEVNSFNNEFPQKQTLIVLPD